MRHLSEFDIFLQSTLEIAVFQQFLAFLEHFATASWFFAGAPLK